MTLDSLPNIRSVWLPDPGYTLVECDLGKADIHVVAWDSGCESLKRDLRNGVDIYADPARFVYEVADPYRPHVTGTTYRQHAKSMVNAADYVGGARTVSEAAVAPLHRVEAFIRDWTRVRHPQIHEWHRRIEWELTTRKSPTIRNAFGFRRSYVGGPQSRTGNLLGQALAWIAQSTVGVSINKAMLRVDRELPECELLMQIHDSLLMQVPTRLCPAIFPRILSTMRIEIPYPDPLVIPLELKFSTHSWGEMEKWHEE